MKHQVIPGFLLVAAIALAACTNVAQMRRAYEAGDDTQLAKLIGIAARPDYPYATRKSAVEALGDIGHRDAVPALIQVLVEYDRRTTLKEQAILALGKIGDTTAVEPIGRLLDRSLSDPQAELRVAAIPVLGSLGGTAAAEILVNALQYYDGLMLRAEHSYMRGVFSGEEQVFRGRRDSLSGPMDQTPGVGLFPGEQREPVSMFGTTMQMRPDQLPDTTPEERALAHEALVKVGAAAVPVIEELLSTRQTTVTLRRELDEILAEVAEGAGPAAGS